MLFKLKQICSQVVDFINILQAAIMGVDTKGANKDYQVVSQFGLLESTEEKAAGKHVGEIYIYSYIIILLIKQVFRSTSNFVLILKQETYVL